MTHHHSFFHSGARPRGIGEWLVAAFAVLLLLIGVFLFAGGGWLIALGGSWYYLLAGIGLLLSGIFILAGLPLGAWLYLLTWALTWVWAIWEVGFNGWALVPRVVAPTVLAVLALACLPVLYRRAQIDRESGADDTTPLHRHPAGIAAAAVLILAGGMVIATHTHSTAQEATNPSANPPAPATPQPVAPLPPAGAGTSGTTDLGATQPPTDSTPAQAADAGTQKPPVQQAALETGADWPAWGGTYKGTRYSPLDQINVNNVGKLQKVWTYRTGDMPSKQADGKYSPENTPLKVGDSLYVCSPKNIIIALDPRTGKERWRYDPKVPDDAIPYGATCRGVVYYHNPAAAENTLCANRIIEGTLDARLIAVDASSGQLCSDFGIKGEVSLLEGIGHSVPGWYGNVAAPTVVRGIVVMGAQVLDGQAEDAPSGVIRGYDAVTGKLAWAWDMCKPELTGVPPDGETYTRGTPNMWTSAAGDEELGYVYIPLGNSAVDYYGGNRKACENEYSSSVVAIDVTTGKPVWHFQTVHYDLWDYDLGSQPTLVDVPKDGAKVPALILPSKQGEIYVLNRRTGESLFPVEEKKAPSGGVEAENLSPTQPYSGFATVARPPVTETDMWGMSPLDQLWCRIQFHKASYKGEFTPPTQDQRYLEYPGYNGGSDWGSVAVDPTNDVLIVNYNDMANSNRLLTRQEADQRDLTPVTDPQGKHDNPQAGSPYAVDVNAGWRVPFTGMMCTQPPYGGIRAIDLKTGKTLWDHPLGEARENGPFGIPSHLPFQIGTPNNGGALVTAGGLIFIAATTDNLIRAIDIKTGKVVWQDTLPAGGQATPMTFSFEGRQYIGFMAGGHHFMETPIGDYVMAWALPEASS